MAGIAKASRLQSIEASRASRHQGIKASRHQGIKASIVCIEQEMKVKTSRPWPNARLLTAVFLLHIASLVSNESASNDGESCHLHL